jgi:hypothetical protein
VINSYPVSESSDSGLIPIENLIHVIRGQQVMLDSDLAQLYGVETKYLQRAVKANHRVILIDNFVDDPVC